MTRLQVYHRPQRLEEALQLLARDGVNTAVLAGGTQLVAHVDEAVEEVVDLQAVGLDEIGHDREGRLVLGAMVRLQTIVEDERVPSLVRVLARREGPNTFRNQGAAGGALIALSPESEFVAGLLAYDAAVRVQTPAGEHDMALADFIADTEASLDGGILVAVTLATEGRAAHARVARTPSDYPIVAAVARRDPEGSINLALCGVAATPVLVAPNNLDELTPPADFRGSSEYRKEMARVLAARVLAVVENGD